MTDEIERLGQVLPLDQYGRGEAKSFQQLSAEITSGETQIRWQDGRPLRLVRIVVLRVCCRGKTLFEDRQEFPDGRVRRRAIGGLTEKLHPQETHREAVYRALQEELNLPADELKGVVVQFLD
jgi:hypothetical protein